MQQQALDNMKSDLSRGYVTLLIVLIVSLVGIVFAFSALTLGGDSAQSTLVLQKSFEARTYADACAERGLIQIKNNDSFSGSGSDTFTHGTCEFSVTFVDPTESVVESQGVSEEVIRKVQVIATTEQTVSETGTTTAITATVWTDVADF